MTVGGLHGLGEVKAPLLNICAAMLVQFLLTYFLTPIPYLNINGAALGRVAGYGIAMVLNYRVLKKYFPEVTISTNIFIKVGAALLGMGVSARLLYSILHSVTESNSLSLLPAIVAAALVYFIILFKLDVFQRQEVQSIPGYGEKLAKFLTKKRN